MNRTALIFARAALVAASPLLPGWAIGTGGDHDRGGPEHLGPCSRSDFTLTRFFDTLPVDLSTVSGVVPLGTANGTSHILPNSTATVYTPFSFGGADGRQMLPAVLDAPIRIPGDATVTALRWEPNSGGELLAGDDWTVTFRPCREISFTFHHLNAVTGPPQLIARAAQIRRGIRAWCTHDSTGAETSCSGLAQVRVRSGTIVGTVYRLNQVSFNFASFDTRPSSAAPAPPLGAAVVPERYELTYDQLSAALTAAGEPIPRALTPALFAEIDPSRTHARCPLDYFTTANRDALYAKLGSYDGSVARTAEPRCGQVFQDSLDGGLAGGWFPESLAGPFLLAGEDGLAAFLYGSVEPLRMYFLIGTSVAPALGAGGTSRIVTFAYPGYDPPGGTRNVSFRGARYRPELPSQTLYCWDELTTAEMSSGTAFSPTPVPGVMLAQFASPARLRFEYSPAGDCATPPAFTSAAGYFLR